MRFKKFLAFSLAAMLMLASCGGSSTPQAQAPAINQASQAAAPTSLAEGPASLTPAAPNDLPAAGGLEESTPENSGNSNPAAPEATLPTGGGQPGEDPNVGGGQADPGCVIGAWELADFDSYVQAVLPPAAMQQGTIQFTGQNGSLRYTFAPDGTMRVDANAYESRYTLAVDGANHNLVVSLNGSASGRYRLDGNILSAEGLDPAQMTFSAVLDGATIADTSMAGGFAPLFSAPYQMAQYECSADTLLLQITELPPEIAPLAFDRVVQ